ncbi:MarR family winged helix-turn-helix transcriptional regulator [Pseudomonas citronellolis]|uniref:MarR family winged helix-turn-helix transcriptional regulator n=1 Tax=Pseudomonas citronellolis TaxID=53408 RepID=UPI0023E35BBB|nr:MarR family transcriptional regulator [Pseudomonas citronellolis]MDF3933554.1 MarR family transcriptional regulator [Pseudomonas citronellolis]
MKTDDVLETIHAVMHLYRSRQYRELRDGPHDLTHMEFKVLAFFARRPGATQRELVEHSGRDKAQIARLIQALRGKGLLEGSADEQDKRSVRLTLSADGQAVYGVVEGQGRRLSDVAVRGFSAQEREQLQALLTRVEANLQAD